MSLSGRCLRDRAHQGEDILSFNSSHHIHGYNNIPHNCSSWCANSPCPRHCKPRMTSDINFLGMCSHHWEETATIVRAERHVREGGASTILTGEFTPTPTPLACARTIVNRRRPVFSPGNISPNCRMPGAIVFADIYSYHQQSFRIHRSRLTKRGIASLGSNIR